MRQAVLLELIKTDLEIRWRRGEGRTLEFYTRSLTPNWALADRLPAALIHEEFWSGGKYGDRPGLDSYRHRFPGRFGELQRLYRRC